MIAIPNMSKPKSCNKCPFTCEALQFFNGTDIPQSCPLFEIVRCGECKYQVKGWHEDNRMKSKGFYYYHCDRNEDPFVAHTVNGEPTDFCSYGERRADE